MAVSDGHQCQPSLSNPAAIVWPSLPRGMGWVCRGGLGGYAVSPLRPATPTMRSLRSKNGSSSSYDTGQSSATPSRGPDPEVGRMEAGEVGAPVDGASADRVVHQRLDRGGVVVDWVVLGQSPDVGIGVEVGLLVDLPVVVSSGVLSGVEPSALIEACDIEAGLGQTPGEGGSRSPRADDEDVYSVVVRRQRELLIGPQGLYVAVDPDCIGVPNGSQEA